MSEEKNGRARDSHSEDEAGEEQNNYLIPVSRDGRSGNLAQTQADDESNKYFMSEPSLSEADSSGRVRASHQLASSRPFHQVADEEVRGVVSPQPFHTLTLPSPVPSSPGNTSLSSWESPAWKKGSVQVHFGPAGAKPDRAVTVEATKNGPVVSVRNQNSSWAQLPGKAQSINESTGKAAMVPHVPDILVASSTDRPPGSAGQSFDQVRQQSRAVVEDAADLYSLDESALLGTKVLNAVTDNDQILDIGRSDSAETDVMSNTQESRGKHSISSIHGSALDESIAMTLSESDGEGESTQREGKNGLASASHGAHSDHDSTYQSADDEKTVERPPRIRTFSNSKQSSSRHTRQRSGDGVAASLMTGGKEWKGMEQDNIPFPENHYDDDDQELPNTRELRQSRQSRLEERAQGDGMGVAKGGKKDLPNIAQKPRRTASMPPRNPTRYDTPRVDGRRKLPSSSQSFERDQKFSPSDVGCLVRQHSPGYSPSGSDSSQHMQSVPESDASDSSSDSGGDQPQRLKDSVLGHQSSDPHLHDPEAPSSRATRQNLIGHGLSPFVNLGKTSTMKAPRASFIPRTLEPESGSKEFYICPICRTRQRTFFSVLDAPRQLEGPSGYLAMYFSVYVVSSLFIFGLEEGWKPLDCIYFAVITLTTAGLGDFVPTSDANKIICSIFIYFGVACIGLLLGSYIAGMLDDRASREAKRNQVSSCPNCARIKTLQDNAMSVGDYSNLDRTGPSYSRQHPRGYRLQQNSPIDYTHESVAGLRGDWETGEFTTPPAPMGKRFTVGDGISPRTPAMGSRSRLHPVRQASFSPTSGSSPNHLGSPITQSILGRQKHTRHESLDIGGSMFNMQRLDSRMRDMKSAQPGHNPGFYFDPRYPADRGSMLTSASESSSRYRFAPVIGPKSASARNLGSGEFDDYDDDMSSSASASSLESSDQPLDEKEFKMKAAKYVFLTLKQALANSMVIIAVGCFGFWLVEDFTFVDSWYFTTVLLTTVGYGDIVPVTKGGKLFATVYILVAGTILLNNMSLISMIPLELRKRRIERAVLTQFGDQLDDAALEELATGPVIQRLRLSEKRTHGLNECTREMFSLAMLVRLGKVSEQDIKQTFAAFRRLDVNDEGVLNSKTIIDGMVKKHRLQTVSTQTSHNRKDEPPPPPPPPPAGYGHMAYPPTEIPQGHGVPQPHNGIARPLQQQYSMTPVQQRDIHQPILPAEEHAPPPELSAYGYPRDMWNEQSSLLPEQNGGNPGAYHHHQQQQQQQQQQFYDQQAQQQYYGALHGTGGGSYDGNYNMPR